MLELHVPYMLLIGVLLPHHFSLVEKLLQQQIIVSWNNGGYALIPLSEQVGSIELALHLILVILIVDVLLLLLLNEDFVVFLLLLFADEVV